MTGVTRPNDPAYPENESARAGLNVREYVAAQIMGHVVSVCLVPHFPTPSLVNLNQCADIAVRAADALIARLNGGT